HQEEAKPKPLAKAPNKQPKPMTKSPNTQPNILKVQPYPTTSSSKSTGYTTRFIRHRVPDVLLHYLNDTRPAIRLFEVIGITDKGTTLLRCRLQDPDMSGPFARASQLPSCSAKRCTG